MTVEATDITVTASRWAHGWELTIKGEGSTQVRTLDKAAAQVRDYLDTVYPEVDHSGVRIHLVLDDPAVAERIEQARQARQAAEAAEAEAASMIRNVVADLRGARGLSVRDTAAILDVSPGRIDQLTKRQKLSA